MDGQTVFRRLEYSPIEQIEAAFILVSGSLLRAIKLFLRNRKVMLAFDETCGAFYGKVEKNALWIHDYKPLRCPNGSFQFLAVYIVIGGGRFILGSLPVPRHWNKADYIEKLITHARKFARTESFGLHLPSSKTIFNCLPLMPPFALISLIAIIVARCIGIP